MKKKCPDCRTISDLQRDYPSSPLESLLDSLRLIRVKRCGNCNAAVFVVLGILPITRLTFRPVKEFIFWFSLLLLVLMVGLVLAETFY